MNTCDYGCGQEATHFFKNGKKCCSKSRSSCPAIRKQLSALSIESHLEYMQVHGTKQFKKGICITINTSICAYCGDKANFVLSNGKGCCSKYAGQCPSIRAKNANKARERHKLGVAYTFTPSDSRWWENKTILEVQQIRRKQGLTYKDRLKKGIIQPSFKGRRHSKETRQKISASAFERCNGPVKVKYYTVYSAYMKCNVRVQGTWELAFANFLNEHRVRWERSKTKHLTYSLNELDYIHYYYPDFFLPDSRTYVEIKGYWWKSADGRVDDKRKMQRVIECNPYVDILVLEQLDLQNLGLIL